MPWRSGSRPRPPASARGARSEARLRRGTVGGRVWGTVGGGGEARGTAHLERRVELHEGADQQREPGVPHVIPCVGETARRARPSARKLIPRRARPSARKLITRRAHRSCAKLIPRRAHHSRARARTRKLELAQRFGAFAEAQRAEVEAAQLAVTRHRRARRGTGTGSRGGLECAPAHCGAERLQRAWLEARARRQDRPLPRARAPVGCGGCHGWGGSSSSSSSVTTAAAAAAASPRRQQAQQQRHHGGSRRSARSGRHGRHTGAGGGGAAGGSRSLRL
jgi:hypothetical protein